MSLSKFYKDITGFQATSVLHKSSASCDIPVWDSIVKEEPVLAKEEETEIASEPEQPPGTSESTENSSSPPSLASMEEVQESEVVEDVEISESIESPLPVQQAEVKIDVEAIEQSAFLSGVEAGRKQAEEDFENCAQTLLSICRELDTLRETILRNSTGEIKELVLAISEKIIRHSVSEQDETIISTIKDAIHLAVKSDDFQIQINPDDLAIVQARKAEIIDAVSGLEHIVFQADSTVDRGGCRLESTCCTVDATITGQLKVIQDSIMAKDALPKAKSDTDSE